MSNEQDIQTVAIADPLSGVLKDRHGREKRKLRISVTDRCNFRCSYCMPEDPEWLPRESLLSFEQLTRLSRMFVEQMGITHIRITGGEPMLRKHLESFIQQLQPLRTLGLERISLTTNGTQLVAKAKALKEAGLDDVNISIDSLDVDRFERLTKGKLQPVLDGILATKAAGLPVKLNAVIIRGDNEQDVVPLLKWAKQHDLPLRYIEFMPLDGQGNWHSEKVYSEAQMLGDIGQHFDVVPEVRTSEPATYYRIDGDYRVGVISTISNPFCGTCDRVRLAATGDIFPCLFSPQSTALKPLLDSDANDAVLEKVIRQAIWHKGKGFVESPGYAKRDLTMHAMGG